MSEEDIPVVISFLENTTEEFMNQWGGGRWYKYPVTIEQMTEQFHTRKDNTLYFLIQNDNEIIGSFELDFINWEEKTCGLCRYLIKSEYRLKGFGTEALKIIVQYAFSDLNMKRVNLSVFDFNIGAYKCYKKAGFTEYNRVKRDNGWVAVQMEMANAEW
jgi:RimJ/RimL family protein N-acetyltransferase